MFPPQGLDRTGIVEALDHAGQQAMARGRSGVIPGTPGYAHNPDLELETGKKGVLPDSYSADRGGIWPQHLSIDKRRVDTRPLARLGSRPSIHRLLLLFRGPVRRRTNGACG